MASPTRWIWVSVNSRSWWWTGRPGVLQFMGSQRVGHDWATELNCSTALSSPLYYYAQNQTSLRFEPGWSEVPLLQKQSLCHVKWYQGDGRCMKNISDTSSWWGSGWRGKRLQGRKLLTPHRLCKTLEKKVARTNWEGTRHAYGAGRCRRSI